MGHICNFLILEAHDRWRVSSYEDMEVRSAGIAETAGTERGNVTGMYFAAIALPRSFSSIAFRARISPPPSPNKLFSACLSHLFNMKKTRGGEDGPFSSGSVQTKPCQASALTPLPPPPCAVMVENKMDLFGDTRNDPYYWLRDDDRKNPDVIAYLNQENAYAEHAMAGKKKSYYLNQENAIVSSFACLFCSNRGFVY